MTDAYAKSKGVLFINSTPNDKAPNFKGNILVTKEQVASLIDFLKKGEEAKLQIAGWNQTSQNGKDYISLQTDIKAKLTNSEAFADDVVTETTSQNPFA
tara:strand:+ start:3862 stop:4158 length:297 start_codon:yes stop_codon:yes gene_type:complete